MYFEDLLLGAHVCFLDELIIMKYPFISGNICLDVFFGTSDIDIATRAFWFALSLCVSFI